MHQLIAPSLITEHPELDILSTPAVLVGDIAHTRILVCAPTLPLHEAALLMTEAGVSSIVVVDGEDAVGIWTERDTLAVDFSS
ncbi:MAG: CBS domain-containing protein, partial [Azoarcus sp.]|nr:CBS domain-containing protein [Azoarcus sp.]